MLFSAHDMYTQDLVRETFDPEGFANPLKVIPSGARRSDSVRRKAVQSSEWDILRRMPAGERRSMRDR